MVRGMPQMDYHSQTNFYPNDSRYLNNNNISMAQIHIDPQPTNFDSEEAK